MFKYIRTLNACSGIVETINLPGPTSEEQACEIGTICSINDGMLSKAKAESGAKYLVLSKPNKKGEQTCLRIMAGMILEAETYFDITTCKIGDGATFITSPSGAVDCIDLGGKDCEIIDKGSTSAVTIIVH